jgi:hypothetical protein
LLLLVELLELLLKSEFVRKSIYQVLIKFPKNFNDLQPIRGTN